MVISVATLLTAVAALAAVLALIWLAGRMARFGGMSRRPVNGMLTVQDVIALDSRRRLHLIKCEERRVLVLTGGTQDVVVGWLDRDEPPA